MIKLISLRVIYTVLVACSLSACNTTKIEQGSFLNISSIETELKKGVSTKKDVQRILGSPQGFGGAVFPHNTEAHEVWFYENIKFDIIKSQQFQITMDMNQKVLLVFFSKQFFDGFLWFTGTIKGTSE